MRFSLPRRLERLGNRLLPLEPYAYTLFAAIATLYMARAFYAVQLWQLEQAVAWAMGSDWDPLRRNAIPQIWSAPLDDVFIHFDFARSFARGYPFQWVDGNGYSSGGTSLLYPIVLALGLRIGFVGLSLMHFAAVVGATSTFALLLGLRRCFNALPRLTSYLLPVLMLSVGALDWSLYSGMEVAFFLAIWVLGLQASLATSAAASQPTQPLRGSLVGLGLGSFLIAATRPEAVTSIAVLAVAAAISVWKYRGLAPAWVALLAGSLPGACVVVTQSFVNWHLTGDASAAGAIVKLEVNNPLLGTQQIVDAYWFHLKYQILRVTQYHFANNPYTGFVVWLLAAIALLSAKTRAQAILLWLSVLGWLLTVSFNGQVRWQNERYTMPAVAWLLACAALGVAWLMSLLWEKDRALWQKTLALLVAGTSLGVHLFGSYPVLRDQRWFFGRASRNIFEQHVQAGHLMRIAIKPEPNRVLVGDAGAMTYVSDLPGLDIIGLGGTFSLPFAHASQWGVGASVELIQHLPHSQRPDLMAIYPSWWNSLPLWFGSEIVARVPVRGNVICGGQTKVIYRTDFSSLDDAERPLSVRKDERLVDYLDFADVLNEKNHHYRLSARPAGYVDMKKLPHPENPERDLFDAGRISYPGLVQRFTLKGFRPGKAGRFLLRVAPVGPAKVEFKSEGRSLGQLHLQASDEWRELSLDLPKDALKSELPVELYTLDGGPTLFFLWAIETR